MSISSEITRITNKRDAALTAVANKGVTVPSGSTIDDLPDLISAISTGGGGGATYSVTMSLNGVTSSTDDTTVLQGNSFFADLTPTNGAAIDIVTVTMGGVDITSQVFTPGTKTKTITVDGTYSAADDNASGYSSVSVNVSHKNVQAYLGYATVTATSYTATGVSITVAKTGTYNISWMAYRNRNANTHGTQIYKNGSAVGSAVTTWLNTYGQSNSLINQSLSQGDIIAVYARTSGTSYVTGVGNLIIQEV